VIKARIDGFAVGTRHGLVAHKAIRRRILKVWEARTEQEEAHGREWYAEANVMVREMAKRYRVKTDIVAGVLAVLSPGRVWEANLLDTHRVLTAHYAGRALPLVGTYGRRNMEKAERLLAGNAWLDVVPDTSVKVRAFRACILDPGCDLVVVDRHASRMAIGRETPDGLYQVVADCIAAVASELGLVPHQLQAVTWLVWRRMA